MMKRHAVWSVVLLSGMMCSLLSTQPARGQTTIVYAPPVYQTTYYSPRAAYYPAYPVYRPTFFQAFFGPLAGYYPAYYSPPVYYRVRPRTSYYAPSAVGYAPAMPSPGQCAACTPCQTSACPSGQCGTAYDRSSSASGPHKEVPVPDPNASKPSAGKPRTYSEQKPPMPGASSKTPDKAKPAGGTKKTDGIPSGDSPFKPTRPKQKSGDAAAFPRPRAGDIGSGRKKVEARKLPPPVVIQQRKSKRPPVTEPADGETDPFDQKTKKPDATNRSKSKPSGTATPGETSAKPGTKGLRPTATIRPLNLDRRIVWRTVGRRTRFSVRAARLATPTVDRAFRSNRGWVPVPSGDPVADR